MHGDVRVEQSGGQKRTSARGQRTSSSGRATARDDRAYKFVGMALRGREIADRSSTNKLRVREGRLIVLFGHCVGQSGMV